LICFIEQYKLGGLSVIKMGRPVVLQGFNGIASFNKVDRVAELI